MKCFLFSLGSTFITSQDNIIESRLGTTMAMSWFSWWHFSQWPWLPHLPFAISEWGALRCGWPMLFLRFWLWVHDIVKRKDLGTRETGEGTFCTYLSTLGLRILELLSQEDSIALAVPGPSQGGLCSSMKTDLDWSRNELGYRCVMKTYRDISS